MRNPKTQVFQADLFTRSKVFSKNKFLADPTDIQRVYSPKADLALPVVVDTEFVATSTDLAFKPGPLTETYRGVTTQIKGIFEPEGLILAHPDLEADGRPLRHQVARSGCHIIDFLRARGVAAAIRRQEDTHWRGSEKKDGRLPHLTFVVYCHFAVVDLYKIVRDDYLEDLNRLTGRKRIQMKRRLTAGGKVSNDRPGWRGDVDLPWIVTLNGYEYRVRLKVVDTTGLQGVASLKDIARNVGVEMDFKDALDGWKTCMDQAYFEHPEFDAYALGDLVVYDVLAAYERQVRAMYAELDISAYYDRHRCVSLTIGKTVATLAECRIFKLFGASPTILVEPKLYQDFLQDKVTAASAEVLSHLVNDNRYLLAKCDGGRCRNARPITVLLMGVLCDIDIAGAYGTTMSAQPFPFGIPVTEAPAKNPALKAWLKANRKELVDRLWYARISTAELLDFDQDLFASWTVMAPGWKGPRRLLHRRQDSEGFHITGEVDLDSGEAKTFAREIICGTLTSDSLDWILNVCSPRQRDDLLKKIRVDAWAHYPRSKQCADREEWERRQATYNSAKGKNHYWFSVTMGELTVDQFRALRNKYPKGVPQNNLYKLFGNTSYGDAVSRFFMSSNMIVGSNITGSVRVFMWCLEKALYLVQSITDGGAFDLNQVVHPRRTCKVPTHRLSTMYTMPPGELCRANVCRLAPLGGVRLKLTIEDEQPVLIRGDERLVGKAAVTWVNQAALDHVASLFPQVKIVSGLYRHLKKRDDGVVEYKDGRGLFALEMKQFATKAAFHGSANYALSGGIKYDEKNDKWVCDAHDVKMRSYESKKDHQAFTLMTVDGVGVTLQPLNTYADQNPAHAFMGGILDDPTRTAKLPPFVKTTILKPGDFANRWRVKQRMDRKRKADNAVWLGWDRSIMSPGENVYRTGIPRRFSISQFTCQTRAQYIAWQRTEEQLKRAFGESFELFFTNADGTVDYHRMVVTIDRLIREGCTTPLQTFDPRRRIRQAVKDSDANVYKVAVEKMRAHLKEKYVEPEDPWDSIESDPEYQVDIWDE